MRRSSKNVRQQIGTSLIEVLIGAMFFIPIGLFSVDLATIVLTNQINDHIAKDCARSAANQADDSHAQDAALNTLNNFQKSAIIKAVKLELCKFDESGNGQVKVKTSLEVQFPVPFPGFSGRTFVAQSVEPIVGQPAEL